MKSSVKIYNIFYSGKGSNSCNWTQKYDTSIITKRRCIMLFYSCSFTSGIFILHCFSFPY